jgi:hypothetical protein
MGSDIWPVVFLYVQKTSFTGYRKYSLNWAALTFQCDTPTCPTDAIAAVRVNDNNTVQDPTSTNQTIYPNLPEEDYSPEHLASSILLIPLITNPAYTNVYTAMGRSHPLQQPFDAAFSTFTEVINNHFNWHGETPEPLLTAD